VPKPLIQKTWDQCQIITLSKNYNWTNFGEIFCQMINPKEILTRQIETQAFFIPGFFIGRKLILRNIGFLEKILELRGKFKNFISISRGFLQKMVSYYEKSMSYAEFWPRVIEKILEFFENPE